MIVKNKIHDKAFRTKLKCAYNELYKAMVDKDIVSLQKRMLFERMKEYKEICEISAINVRTENIGNASNLNAWAKKDFSEDVKEKNIRINELENEIKELKSLVESYNENRKKLKSSEEISAIEKYAGELQIKMKEKEKELNDLNTKFISMELEYTNEIDKLKSKISSLEKSNISTEEKTISELKRVDLSGTLETISNLENDILRYKEKILSLKKHIAVVEKSNKNLTEENKILKDSVSLLESRQAVKILSEDIVCNNVEAMLKDELNSIISVFDKMSKVNSSLEAKIAHLNSKQLAVFEENANLKNTLKEIEDSKALIEKERKRLEQLRKDILEEDRQINAKKDLYDTQIVEKDKKLSDYRKRLYSMESRINSLEKENDSTRAALKKQLSDSAELSSAKSELELELMKLKNQVDAYKNGNDSDYYEALMHDLDVYKRALRCSLCDLNIKSCTITKCMHCFCNDCINSRLKARNRKCPSCEIEFNANDVKKIYL